MCLLASNNHHSSYMDAPDDLERKYLEYSKPDDSWTFPFHESCWQILLAYVASASSRTYEPRQIAKHLFNLTYCLPCDRRCMTFAAHDFGGASQFWKSPANIPQAWTFLLADPSLLSIGPADDNEGQGLPTAIDYCQLAVSAAHDPFSSLPNEVNYLLIVFLRSSDLCNFRLSSREIAVLTKPSHLPQLFWASRFAVDREMGFFTLNSLPESLQHVGADWRSLYFHVKHALRDRSQTGHVRNRRRIWESLRPLTSSLMPLLEQNDTLQYEDSQGTGLASQGHRLGALARGPHRQDELGCGGRGIRLFGTQPLSFHAKDLEEETLVISVSFITFNCIAYFCGMRISQCKRVEPAAELSRAGLIVPCSEVQIQVTPQDQLMGIQVASSVSGVVGLGFRVQSAAGVEYIKTAGMIDKLSDSVGIANLKPGNGRRISGLKLGLDACKVVSVQLLEYPRDNPIVEETLRNEETSEGFDMPWLWHPGEPDLTDDVVLPATRNDELTFAFDMDFGGPDGTFLSRLERIVAFRDDLSGSLRGFAFFYSDGLTRSFGMRNIIDTKSNQLTCIEQSHAIDGAGGERIVALDSSHKTTESGNHFSTGSMQHLGVRYLTFTPDKESTCSTTSPMLCNSVGNRPQSPNTVQIHYMKAARPLQNTSSCFTSATLSNIRRIRLSAGTPDHVRGPEHISGICVELWDNILPVYVGQWLHEVASFQLERGHRISGLALWQTQETNPNNTARENSGRITGINIETKQLEEEASSFELCLGDRSDKLAYSFTENPFETLCSLVWVFNHQYDYIHVETQPHSSRSGTVLSLHGLINLWPNSRVPEKLFWELEDGLGNRLSVARVHAAFKYSSKQPAGFIFDYRDGRTRRHAGCVLGEMASMDLDEGEHLTRIDVFTDEADNPGVYIRTSSDRVCFLSAPSSKLEQLHQGSDLNSDSYMFDRPAERFREDPSADPWYVPGKEECVGIWVTMKMFPRALNVIHAVGPILTSRLDPVDEASKFHVIRNKSFKMRLGGGLESFARLN
ncbi:hypothetical protein FZEAL_4527 [Fusarium zealandicum]|uniref:DUF7600 domain-containing protein n=1 Tax=Fusarium zealandicum TaxID=1053134 RepID=A0A8H4ULI3_9HYPO|nr:hypothetical protein FZEAL_4527 [Fusarium zealandicum]